MKLGRPMPIISRHLGGLHCCSSSSVNFPSGSRDAAIAKVIGTTVHRHSLAETGLQSPFASSFARFGKHLL